MRRLILSALALTMLSCGSANALALRKMSEKEMTAAADVVVTGRVIGIGFSHDDPFDPKLVTEFAAVLVESGQKGVPALPLKVMLSPGIAEARPVCCITGARYKMHLLRLRNGMYESVDGRYGIVRLN